MKLSIQYGTKTIEFEVEYRHRKSLSIEINPPDKILVISPKGLDVDKIKEVVHSKGKWIVQKLYEFKDMEYVPFKRDFVSGEAFMYLGRNYSTQILVDATLKKPEVKLYHGKFYIKTPVKDQEVMKKTMIEWYREKCEKKIQERIEFYKYKIGREPRSIKIKEQKKRWGSCTSKKTIYINSRISMAKVDVIDYIIVHEFSHLVHMNHSKDFYNLVEEILPDFRKSEKWLKENSYKLTL